MNQILDKKVIQDLMKIEGEARGVVFKTDAEYILKEKGEDGLKKLELEFAKLGFSIKFKEIKSMNFYPVGLRAISLLVIKKIFSFDDEKVKEMGLFATKTSLIIKLFIKYFFSIQRVFFEEAPKIWRKHWTVGELNPIKLDEKEKYGILRVKNFNLHPIYCCYLEGYFSGILQMLIKTQKITCEETKCPFRGDEYHEFLLKWQ